MSNMLPVRLLLAAVAIAGALATMSCEPSKAELTTVWLFGPDTLLVDTANRDRGGELSLLPEAFKYESKQVTFYFNFDHVSGENADFLLFDQVEYGKFVFGNPATPLQKMENSPSCLMWWPVNDPGVYHPVVRYRGSDSASTKLFGAIYATYWKVK